MESLCKLYKLSLKELCHRRTRRKIKEDEYPAKILPTNDEPVAMPTLAELSTCPWFWPSIGGYESSILLENSSNGTFLVRRSFTSGQLFTLSYKEDGCVRSMRIQQHLGYFSLDFSSSCHAKARTLAELIAMWKKQASDGYMSTVRKAHDGRIEKVPFRLKTPLLRPVTLKDHCRKAILKSLDSIDDVEALGAPITVELYLKELCYRSKPKICSA